MRWNLTQVCILLLSFSLVACSTTSTSSSRRSSPAADTASSADKTIVFGFPISNYKRVSRGYTGKHKGVDISAPKGTPIYAAESGWITYQGRRFRGYGKLVILEHSQKWATFYAHMTAFELKEGSWVNKGDVIGYVGNTGRSTAPHLHFEIRYNNTAIDPMQYFNANNLKFTVSSAHDHAASDVEE